MVLSKDLLRKNFSENYKRFYEVELFRQEGFERKVCPICGKGFWTADPNRADCGDSSHTPYSFIRDKPVKMGYGEFWKKFADFWQKRGHAVIPRYPTLSRWRDDLYFTIASIVDFQRLQNGKTVFEYPANPLVVPQVCLRFNDIANVGVTGRHLSCFMMAGQHAFDCDHAAYWKDDCIKYNYEFLTQVLGIPKNEITYGEDVWSIPDFSSFGPCIESFSKASELVNSVFTEYRAGPNDSLEPLEMKVIDVGWGFERLLWYYTGAPSIYDATFPNQLDFMRKNSQMELPQELFDKYSRLAAKLDVETVHNLREEKQKIAQQLGISLDQMEKTIAPMQALYAIADHSRTLLFALTDGALPSNAAGGYNLRVLARRVYSFMDEYPFDFSLMEVLESHARDLKGIFPELSENLAEIHEILDEEKAKYSTSRTSARKTAQAIIAKDKPLGLKEMSELYESHGVTPEVLTQAAAELGKPIEIPAEFYRQLTDKHLMEKHAPKVASIPIEGLPATRSLYYELPYEFSATAKILRVQGNKVVLDQTVFYPEGGGQVSDTGTLGGVQVLRADKVAGVVIHTVESPLQLKDGMTVKLEVDGPRRLAIMRHHSATHVMIQASRRLLGNHIWQCGSLKEPESAHVDITHYKKLSQEQLDALELAANIAIWSARPITMMEMERGEAEAKYGFRLYQGGGAIGKMLRVVEISDYDVQACGGVHVGNTSEIGFIKIIGVEHIQDGVVRLRYQAGPAALAGLAGNSELVAKACANLNTNLTELPATTSRIFAEWKEKTKETERLYEQLATSTANALIQKVKAKDETLVQAGKLSQPDKFVEKLVLTIAQTEGLCAVASNEAGFIACACHPKSPQSAADLLAKAGAKGGGNQKFARGKLD
jgi:alanyl-tRNA synthetase